jgi:hypothetical protein
MKQKNFYMLPNGIFNLKLDAYEFLIYSYLVSCAGIKGECWPSIQTMNRVLGISTHTAIRKIDSLIAKRLIDKENTTSINRNGRVRTSNNHYFIRDFSEAWDYCFRFTAG